MLSTQGRLCSSTVLEPWMYTADREEIYQIARMRSCLNLCSTDLAQSIFHWICHSVGAALNRSILSDTVQYRRHCLTEDLWRIRPGVMDISENNWIYMLIRNNKTFSLWFVIWLRRWINTFLYYSAQIPKDFRGRNFLINKFCFINFTIFNRFYTYVCIDLKRL